MVTGIANGLAVVAPTGEGLAAVGPGEQILPAGAGKGKSSTPAPQGGPTTFQINVNGVGAQDLKKIIEQKVNEGIYEYKRREKFT
jgi:hypothetical protein